MKKGALTDLDNTLFKLIEKHGINVVLDHLNELDNDPKSSIRFYQRVKEVACQVCAVSDEYLGDTSVRNDNVVFCRMIIAHVVNRHTEIPRNRLATLIGISESSIKNYKTLVPHMIKEKRFNKEFNELLEMVLAKLTEIHE